MTKTTESKRIAIVGAGISGIAVARVLQAVGHEVVIYEKSAEIGGIWSTTYPEVFLQNTRDHYFLSDFDYPEEPAFHPTGEQIRQYLNDAVRHFDLDVRKEHKLTAAEPTASGWHLSLESPQETHTDDVDFLIVATGQYNTEKPENEFPGVEAFEGEVVTELDVENLDDFDGQSVAVVGFGKSAVDMAVFTTNHGAHVEHIFRTPRWLLPFRIFGIHYSRLLFSRASTTMMPCWAHASRLERVLHRYGNFLTRSFWGMIQTILKLQLKSQARKIGGDAKAHLAKVTPDHPFVPDLRSALALEPHNYFRFVGSGKIKVHHSAVQSFNRAGLLLTDGTQVDCDKVILSIGSKTPAFPFLPDEYREFVEGEYDGAQLYRHLIHPDIPNLAFAGFNHGFMHVPSAEIGALWLAALLAGDIELPERNEQRRVIEKIRDWKREHIHFEPSRSCAVNTRFQQYNDILLRELGMKPYRKMPNFLAEFASGYGAGDYAGIVQEFLDTREQRGLRQTLPLAT